MTVEELIEELSSYPRDLNVYVETKESTSLDVSYVETNYYLNNSESSRGVYLKVLDK